MLQESNNFSRVCLYVHRGCPHVTTTWTDVKCPLAPPPCTLAPSPYWILAVGGPQFNKFELV